MKKTAPIGLFDSGVGGITVWHEVAKLLPKEHTIYLADNKHAPYGSKTKQEILDYSIRNTEFLLSKGVKLIVVACNTATTNTIDQLRNRFPEISFIGVEPAIKPAASLSLKKRIAVLATYGTLHSEEFLASLKKPYMQDVSVLQIAGEGLVRLIEDNRLNSTEMKDLVAIYTKQMLLADIDQLVLGCTHYPYIKPLLKEALPKEVNILDSGQAIAKQTKVILESKDLLNQEDSLGEHSFFYNKASEAMINLTPKSERSHLELIDF